MDVDIDISDKQAEFLRIMEDPEVSEVFTGGGAGTSKSFSAGLLVALWARKYPGIRFFVGRKTLKSLKQSTINTMLSKVFPTVGITTEDYHMGWQTMELTFKNGSIVIFGEMDTLPSDPVFQRYGSLELDVAIIDEAGEVSKMAKDAIKSRTGRGIFAEHNMPGKLLLVSNPELGWLKDEYYTPYEKLGGGEMQKWQIGTINGKPTYRVFLKMTAYDNPFLPDSYIDNLKTLPPVLMKRLLLGSWNYADDDSSLFRAGLLDKAMCYELPESSPENTFVGCFDETTEILTENGFKKFKDLAGEKVLARKPSGFSEYVNYDNYIEYEYSGDMYNLENQGASVFVTPNHKMLYASPRGETELEEIQNISLSEWKIIRRHDYHYGLFQDEFPFYLGYNKKDFFAFLGWFISEGCVVGDAVVNITQRIPEKKNIIRELLKKMNIRFSESSQNFAIHNKKLAGWLLDNVKKYTHSKEIPRMVTYCSNWSYIEAFLDAYCDGDGTRRKGRRLCYVSSSKKIIDSLQIILSHFNRQGRISLHHKAGTEFMIEGRQAKRKHDTYVLYERDTNSDAWVKNNQIKKIPFKGKVYCVSNKYHTIYVRRNGVCYWIGNCDLADSGNDFTVFSLMKNGVLVNQKNSSVQMNWEKDSRLPMGRLVTDELVEFAQRNGIDQRLASHIAVECNGIGSSVRDFLRERGWQVLEYTATHKSRSENYYNLMMDMDAGDVKIYQSMEGLDELRRELMAHSYELINQEPSVVKKDKIKQALGHSPDFADSFQICNYARRLAERPELSPHTNKNRIAF